VNATIPDTHNGPLYRAWKAMRDAELAAHVNLTKAVNGLLRWQFGQGRNTPAPDFYHCLPRTCPVYQNDILRFCWQTPNSAGEIARRFASVASQATIYRAVRQLVERGLLVPVGTGHDRLLVTAEPKAMSRTSSFAIG
jgi:hypothetical protein